jgi:nucleoside-diphosphate-sugar epimerase
VCGHNRHPNFLTKEIDVMRVFVAGGTGLIGRRLVQQLAARGHQVTATTTSPGKLQLIEQLGADAVVMNGIDERSGRDAVAKARADAIAHEMTAIATKPDMRHFDGCFTQTNRLRTEGTDHLLAAAAAAGISNVVAQSYGGWNELREGGWIKTEVEPLERHAGTAAQKSMDAIRYAEDAVVKAGGAALRYGSLYGPGAG